MRGTDLIKAFAKFDKENPEVYELFVRFAFEASKTRKRFSAHAILHRIRWETQVMTVGSTYKIANYLAAFYARKFVKEYPQFKSFFTFKKSVADNAI